MLVSSKIIGGVGAGPCPPLPTPMQNQSHSNLLSFRIFIAFYAPVGEYCFNLLPATTFRASGI